MDHFEFYREYIVSAGNTDLRIRTTLKAHTLLGREILRSCGATKISLTAERTSSDSQNVLHMIKGAEAEIISEAKLRIGVAAKLLKRMGLLDWFREEDIPVSNSNLGIEEE